MFERTKPARWAACHLRAHARQPLAVYRRLHLGRVTPGDARARRCRPFHGARHLQRDACLPNHKPRLRGDRGARREQQRGNGPRDDRLLGAAPGARGRAGIQRPVPSWSRAHCCATHDIARERDIIVEEIRSYRDDPGPVRLQPLRPRLLRRHARSAGRSPARRRRSGRCPRRTSAASGRTTYRPGNSVISVAGDLDHARKSSTSCRATSEPATAVVPTFTPAPPVPLRAAERRAAATFPRRTSASACRRLRRDHAGPVGARDDQHGPRRRLEQPALPKGARGCRTGLRRPHHSRPTTPTSARSRSTPASTRPTDRPTVVRRSSASCERLRDEPIPIDELDRARNVRQRQARAQASRRAATCRRGSASRRRSTNAC